MSNAEFLGGILVVVAVLVVVCKYLGDKRRKEWFDDRFQY